MEVRGSGVRLQLSTSRDRKKRATVCTKGCYETGVYNDEDSSLDRGTRRKDRFLMKVYLFTFFEVTTYILLPCARLP